MKKDMFSVCDNTVNMLNFLTDITTTCILYNNTKKAKSVLLWSSVTMSCLAIGVSVFQSSLIMENLKQIETSLLDAMKRNGQRYIYYSNNCNISVHRLASGDCHFPVGFRSVLYVYDGRYN